MTAKQYLNQAKTLEYAIKSKQEELHYLTEKSRYIQNTALSERIQSSHNNNSNAIIDKIIDMETEINSEIEHLIDLKAEIRQKIARQQSKSSATGRRVVSCMIIMRDLSM